MKSLLVLLVIAVAGASAVKFTDCGTTVKDLQTKIENCGDSDDACPFYIGENATISANFNAVTEIKSAQVKIFGKLGPVFVPFALKPAEACGNWGMTCPVAAGQKGQFTISLPVLPSYPTIKVGVRLELWDKNSKLVCTTFPAQLKKKA